MEQQPAQWPVAELGKRKMENFGIFLENFRFLNKISVFHKNVEKRKRNIKIHSPFSILEVG
jgi:hypothetical protein